MRSIHVLSLAAVILFAVGCGTSQPADRASSIELFSQTFQTNGAPMVLVQNFRGTISVKGGTDSALHAAVTRIGRGDTQVVADGFLHSIDVAMTRDGNIIRLTTASDRPESDEGTGDTEILLTVPEHADLSLQTGHGGINVTGVLASIVAQAVEGDIQIMGGEGVITATSGRGSIALVPSGPVLVTALTTNGDIRFVGTLTEGTNTFGALNGNVSLELPQTASFVVDATTQNGRVTSDFDVRGQGNEDETLRGQVGEHSGAVVEVRATNGSIHLGQGAGGSQSTLLAGGR